MSDEFLHAVENFGKAVMALLPPFVAVCLIAAAVFMFWKLIEAEMNQ